MRVAVAAFVLLAPAGAALAQEPPAPPPVLDQVYACAGIEAEAERLACYDGAVGRLRQAQSAGQFVAVDRAQATELEREAFGFSLPSIPRLFNFSEGQAEIADITTVIARVGARADGKQLYFLENGHTWVQIDGENRRARAGANVTIRRAALGSFMMSLGDGAAIRVRRQE